MKKMGVLKELNEYLNNNPKELCRHYKNDSCKKCPVKSLLKDKDHCKYRSGGSTDK